MAAMANATNEFAAEAQTIFLNDAFCNMILLVVAIALLYGTFVKPQYITQSYIIVITAFVLVFLQWFLFGYGLSTFSLQSPASVKTIAYISDVTDVSQNGLSLVLFKGMFAVVSAVLMSGMIVGTMRPMSAIVFILLWTTIVYDFIANIIWSPTGFFNKKGVADFAGGIVVHVTAGFSSLAMLEFFRRLYLHNWTREAIVRNAAHKRDFHSRQINFILRQEELEETVYQQLTDKQRSDQASSKGMFEVMGLLLLWFGWNSFNSGSNLVPNQRADLASINTNIAVVTGILVWVFLDYVTKKTPRSEYPSLTCLNKGIVVSLVGITPLCGFITPGAAFICTIMNVALVNVWERLTFKRDWISDHCHVFLLHGIPGSLGVIFCGFFKNITQSTFNDTLAGAEELKGLFYGGGGALLGWQLAALLATIAWSVCITWVILVFINYFMGIGPMLDCRNVADKSLFRGNSLVDVSPPPPSTEVVNQALIQMTNLMDVPVEDVVIVTDNVIDVDADISSPDPLEWNDVAVVSEDHEIQATSSLMPNNFFSVA